MPAPCAGFLYGARHHHGNLTLGTRTIAAALLFATLLLTGCDNSDDPTAPETPAPTGALSASDKTDTGDGSIENRGSEAAENTGKWWSALPRKAWSDFEEIDTRNPWFEVFQILDGVYAIYEPGQFEEVISWLIVGSKQALLFDTGLGMGSILSVVKQLTGKPVVVLNSHTHYDHVGGNHQFDVIMGRNHPYSLAQSKGLSNAEVGEYARGDWIWKTHPHNFDARSYAIKPWSYARWVDDAQTIDLGGVSLEVIYAPGHAPDSLVLVDHARKLMFTGDTFYLAPLYAHLEGSSIADYAATAAKLAAMSEDLDYLLMSHNTPVAEARYLQQLDAAFKAILDGSAEYTLSDSGREYPFDGFSILTRDPPAQEAPVIELL